MPEHDEKISERDFFCFIHIPKCGGQTFDAVLQRNLGPAYLRLPHELYEGFIPAFNLKLYIEESSSRLAIGGHRISLDQPDLDESQTIIRSISFIRNPIDRIRSEFFYIKNLPGNVSQNKLIRQLSYPDYLQHLMTHPDDLEHIRSYQTRHLFGKRLASIDTVTELINAQKLFLFPLDRFEDACIYLENAFPTVFRDASFVERNVNKKQPQSDENYLEQELQEKLTQDNELYHLAQTQMNDLLAPFTPQEWAIAKRNFQRRCWLRQRFYAPVQRLTHKLNRITSSW